MWIILTLRRLFKCLYLIKINKNKFNNLQWLSDSKLEDYNKENRKVKIELDNKTLYVDSELNLALALYNSGIKVLSRSIKYHRPRGIFCLSGKCSNCLMTVNGLPNVRACQTNVSEGLKVKVQNAFPNGERDFLSILDKLSFLMPVGFYYKYLAKPRILWELSKRLIQSLTGLGKLPKEEELCIIGKEPIQSIECDVVVIGGGIAGISASLEAVKTGVKVILIDENSQLGGKASLWRYMDANERSFLSTIIHELEAYEGRGLSILRNSVAFGFYEGNELGVLCGNKILRIRGKATIFATGSYDKMYIFENNDLPNIFTTSGILKLVNLYHVKPFGDGVIIGSNGLAIKLAYELIQSGVKIKAVAEINEIMNKDNASKLQELGVEVYANHTIDKAEGTKGVKRATLIQIDKDGKKIEGTSIKINCNFICIASYPQPTFELISQAECKMNYSAERGGFIPNRDEYLSISPNIYVVGDAGGICHFNLKILEGRLAGISAAINAGSQQKGLIDLREDLVKYIEKEMMNLPIEYTLGAKKEDLIIKHNKNLGKSFICFCLDILEKDIVDSVKEGYRDIEEIKRYTGIGTGICQGKRCLINAIRVFARELNLSLNDPIIHIPTQRPPITPIPLGVLAKVST